MKTLTEIVSSETKLNADEQAIALAVDELADWVCRHQAVLMTGRLPGFEIGISEELRSALLILGSKNINNAVSNIGSFSWDTQPHYVQNSSI